MHSGSQSKDDLEPLVEHLFRRQSGRLVATLTGIFGAHNLGLAEEVVQEALLEALRRWPMAGVPREPAAWLMRVARNKALDRLRRRSTFDRKKADVASLMERRLRRLPEAGFSGEIDDDQLRLIFTCCHPALPANARVALTLKTVCGFSVREIAAAFLCRESTIAQRLTRAKRRIVDLQLPYTVPEPRQLPRRLDSVLKVLYLMFNEGYGPVEGPELVRFDICEEAIRLASSLAEHPVVGHPKSRALAALLLLQGARLAARQDEDGELLLLAEQDRSLWNRGLLERGFRMLQSSINPDEVSDYHLEAGIAACHGAATDWRETDWPQILAYYDQLMELSPTPIRALNRAVALSLVRGPAEALGVVEQLAEVAALRSYYLLPATRGELCRQLGSTEEAKGHFREALQLARSQPVIRFLERRIALIG